MKVKNGALVEFAKVIVENQGDSYGEGIVNFAERWANLMEDEIEQAKGRPAFDVIRETADKTSDKADTEYITGFMYACALNLLTDFWVYGDDLKTWHANKHLSKDQGVTNPAPTHERTGEAR